ncbi:MAG: 5-formyltetrahydrofolate cyclo-ligase [Pseudomonadota bacterium]
MSTALRTRIRAMRSALDAPTRRRAGAAVSARIQEQSEWQGARRIAGYLAVRGELDVGDLLATAHAAGRLCFVPVIEANSGMRFRRWSPTVTMTRNRFGIAEPALPDDCEPAELDMVLAPLVAFDEHGNRLGMGGGYYDRYLAFLGPRRTRKTGPLIVGIGYECQRVDALEASPWDVQLDCMATETRWRDFRNQEE